MLDAPERGRRAPSRPRRSPDNAPPHTVAMSDRVEESPARDVVRQLLAAAGAGGGGSDLGAVQVVLERAVANLRGSFGEYGADALLARALRRAEPAHPALREIRDRGRGKIRESAISAAVDAHGQAAVRAGLEAIVVELVEGLSELIGADMASSILAYAAPLPRAGAGGGA